LSLFPRIWNALRKRVRHVRILISARKSSQRNLQGRTGGNILVICYGNIYRSPFVEMKLCQHLNADRFTIRSAGFFHKSGRSCATDYIPLAREFGVPLDNHRSRRVEAADIVWADLIVIMDRKNWNELLEYREHTGNKIVWIACLLDVGWPEVDDPYGMDEEGIQKILERLNQSTEAIIKILQPES